MKQQKSAFIFLIFIIFAFANIAKADFDSYFTYINRGEKSTTKYRYGYTKGIKVTITPDKPEFQAGSLATFTVTITNKNKYSVNVDFPTGQQWDMVIYHGGSQIERWSNGYTWERSPHSILLKAGESRSQKLTWVAVNKKGEPLSQGYYKCVGLVICSPKTIVSEEVRFRLTPPSVVKKEIIKTSLNQCFEIELPRFANEKELKWDIVYWVNDNRINATSRKIKSDSIVITFLPKRIGHVEFDLYAYPENLNSTVAVERRSYRIEVE